MTEQLRRQHIQALLRERASYERRGEHDKVKAVDDSLRAYGHELTPKHERAERRAPTRMRRAQTRKPAETTETDEKNESTELENPT